MSKPKSKARICHWCGSVVTGWCRRCTDAIKQRLAPEVMTPDERVAEMSNLLGPLEVPFDVLHERIEQLVGRPVWTHEFTTANWPRLVEEARTHRRPSLPEVFDLIPADKRIDVVVGEGEEAPA